MSIELISFIFIGFIISVFSASILIHKYYEIKNEPVPCKLCGTIPDTEHEFPYPLFRNKPLIFTMRCSNIECVLGDNIDFIGITPLDSIKLWNEVNSYDDTR